jgi:phosphoesterase RecJ-like protein
MTTTTAETTAAHVAAEIRRRQRFVVASHARPDGDAIGSSLAMALALQRLGKQARVVSRDRVPPQMQVFPGVDSIDVVDTVDDPGDAVIILECGDIERTGIAGLERGFVINIDHHVGNSMFGAINWFDVSAAACGEMVFELVRELGVPLLHDIAVHLYVAILTDTGSFHHSNITPRTFEICRECVAAGVNPAVVARSVYDSNNLGRLKLMGAVLSRMQLASGGRLAIMSVDQELVTASAGTYEDTEGLINLPLTVREIQAVLFLKEVGPLDWRVSMRSKGEVNINAVAREFGGGGHKNASGCSASGTLQQLTDLFTNKITDQLDKAAGA